MTMMKVIQSLLWILASYLLVSMSLAQTAALQPAYPVKPIRLVVPFPAGGPTDQFARQYAQALSIQLGKPVVVDNKSGASGAIGSLEVKNSTPDGYTLLFSAAGPLTVSPHTYSKLAYKPIKSFAPIALIAAQPLILVVNANSPFYSVADIIKAGAAKNSKLNYGSFGNGSVAHLAGESFKLATKINMTHIPYKGTSPALTALLGGEIDLMFDTISTSAPFVK